MAQKQSGKLTEYSIVDDFSLGYRNKEDVTNTKPGILIVGSQNVLTNTSRRVQIRQGYVLDGATSGTAAAVLASFDWLTRGNGEKHVRAGGLTSAGNDGSLQYRYVDSNGDITWRDLMTALSNVDFNFTTFWRTDESLRVMLFVNGNGVIYEWNGATAEVASSTAATITKSGTDTFIDAGFYSAAAGSAIIINGTQYTYTGGETTTTLTGVAPNAASLAAGSIIHQAVTATAIVSIPTLPASFEPNLIKVLNNQIFLGSTLSSVLWISNVNDYKDYSSSTPRQTGEGATLILDANLVGLEPQENFMYVTAGQDLWYNVNFEIQTSTVGVTYEQVNALPLKTGRRQAARSQAYLSHMKNNLLVVTQETTVDTFGRVETSLETPQQVNVSDPIKIDIDNYDFDDGSIAYFRNNIYVAVPKEGLVLIYDIEMKSWEAPQTLPISRFYVVDGELYGHSYSTFESYKLFTGYADRVYTGFSGFPIQAVWRFSFQNYGSRFALKNANKAYAEGYINSNTILTMTITYELDGCKTVRTFELDGSDSQFVCIGGTAGGSLGKSSLGKVKLGGDEEASINDLPPKFRWFPTFTPKGFFESSIQFDVLGTDNRAEILAFGLAARGATEGPVQNLD